MRASQPLGTGNGQLTTPYGQQLRDPYKRQPENEAARRYLPENGKWILSRLPDAFPETRWRRMAFTAGKTRLVENAPPFPQSLGRSRLSPR